MPSKPRDASRAACMQTRIVSERFRTSSPVPLPAVGFFLSKKTCPKLHDRCLRLAVPASPPMQLRDFRIMPTFIRLPSPCQRIAKFYVGRPATRLKMMCFTSFGSASIEATVPGARDTVDTSSGRSWWSTWCNANLSECQMLSEESRLAALWP